MAGTAQVDGGAVVVEGPHGTEYVDSHAPHLPCLGSAASKRTDRLLIAVTHAAPVSPRTKAFAGPPIPGKGLS
ncbi:hypothetical protein GCM10015536_59910 [Streptomyces griseomycini]|nr:hypothetical protein GCM10015536_59910 [Streptomyces griseomycini]